MGKKIGNEEMKLDMIINDNQARKKLIDLGERNREISSSLKGLRAEKEKLIKTGKKESEAYKTVTSTISGLNKEMKDNKTEIKKHHKELGITGLTIAELDKKAKELKKSMKHMIPGDPGRKKAEKELKAISDRISEIDGKAKKNRNTMTSSVMDIAAGITVAGIAAKILEWGVALLQNISVMNKFQRQVKQMTGLQGDALTQTTAQVKTLADVYQKDMNEVLISANTLSKEMGISMPKALDLIKQGFLSGADAGGDFLNKVKEYPAQFAAAGLSAEAFIAIATQEVNMGIYDDKGTDTIKEGLLRLREMTPATRAALDSIGLSSKKMQKDIADGTITVFEAMKQVSVKLDELPPQSTEVGTAIADIFGGAGEDAGLRFITSLQDMQTEMKGLINLSDPYVAAQQAELDATNAFNEALAEAAAPGGIWSKTKQFFYELGAEKIKSANAFFTSDASLWTKTKALYETINVHKRASNLIMSKIFGKEVGMSAWKEIEAAKEAETARQKEAESLLRLGRLQVEAYEMGLKSEAYKKMNADELASYIAKENKIRQAEAAKKSKESKDAQDKSEAQTKADAKAQKRQEEKDTREAQRLAAKDQKELEDEIKRIDKLNEVYKNKTAELTQQNELEAEAQRLEKEASELATEEERVIKRVENAKYLADLQLQIELDKELLAVEGVENAEALKQAIREKYLLKQGKLDSDYTKAFASHKKDEVKWADISEEQKLGVATDGLNAISKNVTKGTVAWKAAEVAKAGITTYQSATAAYASMVGIPYVGPILAPIAAGAAVVAGLANVRNIMNTKVPDMPGFQDGLYPMTRTDGKTFDVKYGGSPTTQIVDKPTHFIAGEVQPEMIIDGATFKRLDPAVIQAIQMARFPGYVDGLYPTKTKQTFSADTETSTNVEELSQGLALQELIQIRQLLSRGVLAYYDDDEVRNIKELIDENDLVLRNATK